MSLSQAANPPSGAARRLLALLAVLAVTAAVLSPVLENGFINRDDPDYVLNNRLTRDFSPSGLASLFSTPQFMGNYHPLTLAFLAAEYRLFGLSARGYHLVSLLLHLAATACVWVLARELSGSDAVAFASGLLFGVHPVHVESIAWASEQKDLLYAVFYLAGILAYVRYVRRGLSPVLFAGTMGLFVLSLLSKGAAASFPVALWLIDALHHRAFQRRALWEKLPFALVSLAFGLLAIHAQELSGALLDVHQVPFPWRLATALIALPRYLMNLAAPLNLSAFYPYPEFSSAGMTAEILVALLLVGTATAVAWRVAGREPLVPFGLGFFAATVALVSQIIPVGGAMMADRYMYLPSVGIILAVVAAAERWIGSRRGGRQAVLALVLAAAAGLSIGTVSRTALWRDSVTLWSDLIAQRPSLSFPYVYRGIARTLPDEKDLAFADFDRALALDSTLGFAYYSRGYAEAVLSNHDGAVSAYSKALALGYDPAQALNGRGSSWTALGRYAEALEDYGKAISLDPGLLEAYFNRGNIHAARGDYAGAVADYDEVLRRDPSDAVTRAHRGLARLKGGDPEGGCNDLRSAAAAGVTKAAEAASVYCR